MIWGWVLLIFVSLIMAFPFAYASTKINESGGVYKFIMKVLRKEIWCFLCIYIVAFRSFCFIRSVGLYLIVVLCFLILGGLKIVGNFVRIFGILTITIILYIMFSNGIKIENIENFDIKNAILTIYFGLWTSTGWEGITMPLTAFKNQKAIAYGLLIGTLIIWNSVFVIFTNYRIFKRKNK